MATYAQIVLARAVETQGVWALDAAFTGGGKTKAEHSTQMTTVQTAREDKDLSAGVALSAENVVRTDHALFKSFNTVIAARLDAEVPDTDPLQRRVDQADNIPPDSEANIERRTELTYVIWKEVNTARLAEVPSRPALTVRGMTQTNYESLYKQLLAKRITREEKQGLLSTKRGSEKRVARTLDLYNKNWYQAWKSEFPPGTEKGDALANVHTEEGTPPPGILDITGVTQTGLSLAVAYDAESGEHATVLELLYLVVGVHSDYQRVAADRAAGNTIGPFVQGQVVKLRTDVGNSRDFSELGPEQEATIGPSV